MPVRSSKGTKPEASVRVKERIGSRLLGELPEAPDDAGKNPAAVALGKLGGAKGGAARAAALSPRRRTMIARKAAQARWAKGTVE